MISQDLKKGILLLLSLAALNSTVYADAIWPGMFLFAGVSSLIGILAGFAVELFFVKYFAKTKWSKAIAVTFIMNLVTTVLGIFVKETTFREDWDYFASFIIFAIVNTIIEGVVVKLSLKLAISRTFWWLFLANAISVGFGIIHILLVITQHRVFMS